jgi:hypothetical protein
MKSGIIWWGEGIPFVSKMILTLKTFMNVTDQNPRIPSSITKFLIFRKVKLFPGTETAPATRNFVNKNVLIKVGLKDTHTYIHTHTVNLVCW